MVGAVRIIGHEQVALSLHLVAFQLWRHRRVVQHQLVLVHIALKLPHNGGAGKGNALQHRGLCRKGRQALTQQTQGQQQV